MANEETQSEPPQEVIIEGDTPSSAELIFEKHKKSIVAGLAIIVIAVFAYIVVNHLHKAGLAEAATAFSKATTIADYAAVSTSHSGSVPAGNALLMKADLEFTGNKLDDSRATLDKFVAEYTGHPLYLQGILALGVQEEARGNLDQAQAYYQQVIDAQDAAQVAPLALIRKGDLLYARGDFTAAKSVYQSVLPTYPGTPFSYKVQEKLNREKLQPPPAPVPAPAPEASTSVPVPVTPLPAAPKGPAPTAATKPIQIPATPKKPAPDNPAAPKNSPDAEKPAPAKPKASKPKEATPKTTPAKPKTKPDKPKTKPDKPKAKPAAQESPTETPKPAAKPKAKPAAKQSPTETPKPAAKPKAKPAAE